MDKMVQATHENSETCVDMMAKGHHHVQDGRVKRDEDVIVKPRRSRLISESSIDGMEHLVPLELEDLRRFNDNKVMVDSSAERKLPLMSVFEDDGEGYVDGEGNLEGEAVSSTPVQSRIRAKRNWKCAIKSAAERKDPWATRHWEDLPVEHAIRHKYNPLTKKWKEEPVIVKAERESFGKGAMRECFRLKKLSNFSKKRDWNRESNNYVAKSYMEEVSRDTYFQDVKLQMDAKLWGEEYNRHNPPKKVDIFLMAVLEFPERQDNPLFHVEHFIEGDYIKYNSNSGYVEESTARQTPHAFSHFTFERSGHELIVVDIQGVGDLYTDPQIHTAEGIGYGDGNLGTKGMALFFHSHQCNEICRSLGLTAFDLAPTEKSKQTLQRRKSETVIKTNAILFCESPTDTDKEDFSSFFRQRTKSMSESCNVDVEAARAAARIAAKQYRRNRTYSDYSSIEEPSPPVSATIMEGDEFDKDSDTVNSDTSSCMSWLRRRRMTESSDDSGIVASNKDMTSFHEAVQMKSKPANIYILNKDMIIHDDIILGQVHLDLCRYHELRRFTTDDTYDKIAAFFHLKCAADCGLVVAMKNLSSMYFNMPHDILEDMVIPEAGEPEGTRLGYHYMEEAAKAGDRSSMVFIAKSLDSGDNLDNPEKKSTRAAIDWYEKICEMDEDEVDKTDWGLNDAPYHLLARQAEIWLAGEGDIQQNPRLAGDFYNKAAESAMNCMKGKLANKYYMLAEEAYGQCPDEDE